MLNNGSPGNSKCFFVVFLIAKTIYEIKGVMLVAVRNEDINEAVLFRNLVMWNRALWRGWERPVSGRTVETRTL